MHLLKITSLYIINNIMHIFTLPPGKTLYLLYYTGGSRFFQKQLLRKPPVASSTMENLAVKVGYAREKRGSQEKAEVVANELETS